jgi:processive 1,2-diacylglycerol beta-glucosyltransferase
MDKICPNCGERYKWYDSECPNCHVALVDAPDEQERLKDLDLTVVFTAAEPALLPLATLALEQANIEYATRLSGHDALTAGGIAYRGTSPGAPIEVLVRADDVAAAADLLRDLEQASVTPPAPAGTAPSPAEARQPASGNVELIDLASKRVVGRISEDDLAWLIGQLEEESSEDRDYYLDRPTIDMLESAGGSPALMATLRGALGDRPDIDVQWSRASGS